MESQLGADQRIKSLLDKRGRERYISPKFLKEVSRFPHIESKVWQALADHYPTKEAWQNASEEKVKSLLGKDNEDLAGVVLTRIQAGVAGG